MLLKQLYLPELTLQGTLLYSYPNPPFFFFCLSRSYHLIHYSQAPKAVQAWKSELTSKKRTKIAAIIADPSANPELFEEGWEEVLAREETHGGGTFHCFFFK